MELLKEMVTCTLVRGGGLARALVRFGLFVGRHLQYYQRRLLETSLRYCKLFDHSVLE